MCDANVRLAAIRCRRYWSKIRCCWEDQHVTCFLLLLKHQLTLDQTFCCNLRARLDYSTLAQIRAEETQPEIDDSAPKTKSAGCVCVCVCCYYFPTRLDKQTTKIHDLLIHYQLVPGTKPGITHANFGDSSDLNSSHMQMST